jgi:hypothetical protein
MTLVERLSELFYEPLLFWSLPLLLEAVRGVVRIIRSRRAGGASDLSGSGPVPHDRGV